MKNNQAALKEDIATIWTGEAGEAKPDFSTTTKHGDRIETRRLWVSDVVVGYTDWPHLAQVCRLERIVHRKGKTTREWAYAVTSLRPRHASPELLLKLWRGHWGIENRLHWVRDVVFDEDRCQVRSGAAPQALAAMRNLAIGLLRFAGFPNIAAAQRRHAAHYQEAIALLRASCTRQ